MTETPGLPDLGELKRLAISIAEEAGRLLLEYVSADGPDRAVTDSVRTKSSRTDLVTEADRASERLIIERIRAERPGDAVLAEESGSTDGTSGLTWVVDPLDGTINFVYGFPVFAVSIACRFGADTVVGVVHDPSRRETFSAVAGGGAARDGVALEVGTGPVLAEALIGTGFSYDSDRRRAQGRLVAGVLPFVRDIRRAGSAAIDLCWVAAGRLDAFYEAGLAPWDMAAGSLVASEAGAVVSTIDGLLDVDEHRGVPTLVAATAGVAAPLADLLREASRPGAPAGR